MRTKLIFLISVTLLLSVVSGVQALTITTADGDGADTYLANDSQSGDYGPDSVHGADVSLRAFRQLADTRSKTGYIRFDLSGVAGDLNGAILTFDATFLKGSAREVDVYGLIDGDGDLWDESTITYNTAAGMLTATLGNYALDTAKVTLLGIITTPAAGDPYPVSFSSNPTDLPLTSFLGADTNKLVTFLFIGTDNEVEIASKEHETFIAPTLTLPNAVIGARTSATSPNPADGVEDVSRDVVLSWTPGEYAAAHDVYLGPNFDDVNDASKTNDPQGVLLSRDQTGTTYDPNGFLEFSQTYYWRVDEVNSAPDYTIYPGNVWSFTVEPFVYPIENITATASSSQTGMGPEKTIDNSGLSDNDQHSTLGEDMWLSNITGPQPSWIQYEFDRVYKLHEMWVWNSNWAIESLVGLGLKDVTIEYSTDANDWMQLDGTHEFNRATGLPDYVYNTTVPFEATAKYVKITANTNWGGTVQFGLSEVRFFYKPVHARVPKPADGQEGLGLSVVLSWLAGREATSHEIYFNADRQSVVDGTAFLDTVSQSSYTLTSLEFGRTYYWKIVEVNEAESPTHFEGDVWSFSTLGYSVVDDFEDYNDSEPDRIFDTWVDGWGIDENGSQVGYSTAPFAERIIVNSGSQQSMPFSYNNTGGVAYSEATCTFDTPQDWTIGGVNTLRLYLRGYPTAFLESSAGNIVMSGAGTDIFGTADEFRFAYKYLNGDGSITARVESLVDTDPWAKAGVMIRETLDPGSRWAAVFLTGDNGVRFQARPLSNDEATSDTDVVTSEQTALREPVWIKMERSGSEFNGFYATDEAGTAWTPIVWNPQTINMTSNVCIGLAVTSHSAGNSTIAEFSGVSTTGSVTGQWQVEAVGAEMAENDPDYLYVVVEGGGKTKTFEHPDNPNAVLAADWQQWDIPLSVFSDAGVTLTAVQKMSIGVGSKTAPQQSGEGQLYFDDIRLYPPPEPDPNTQPQE